MGHSNCLHKCMMTPRVRDGNMVTVSPGWKGLAGHVPLSDSSALKIRGVLGKLQSVCSAVLTASL